MHIFILTAQNIYVEMLVLFFLWYECMYVNLYVCSLRKKCWHFLVVVFLFYEIANSNNNNYLPILMQLLSGVSVCLSLRPSLSVCHLVCVYEIPIYYFIFFCMYFLLFLLLIFLSELDFLFWNITQWGIFFVSLHKCCLSNKKISIRLLLKGLL